jgi:membrane associated rhomboid family serine protease
MIEHLHPVDEQEYRVARKRMLTAGIMPALFVLVLASVHLLGSAYGWHLHRLGLQPRETPKLVGILTAPLIHGGFEHLFDNSVALLVLGWCLVYFYPRAAGPVVLWTWLLGGALVWLTARPDMHIGASGVLYGIAAFLFFSGVIRRQRTLMAVSLLVVFLYGSLVWGILPILPELSWESHLWGGAVGAALAWFLRHVAPAHLPKPIVFEDEESGPVITDTDPGDEDPQPRRKTDTLHPPPGYPYDSTDIA